MEEFLLRALDRFDDSFTGNYRARLGDSRIRRIFRIGAIIARFSTSRLARDLKFRDAYLLTAASRFVSRIAHDVASATRRNYHVITGQARFFLLRGVQINSSLSLQSLFAKAQEGSRIHRK